MNCWCWTNSQLTSKPTFKPLKRLESGNVWLFTQIQNLNELAHLKGFKHVLLLRKKNVKSKNKSLKKKKKAIKLGKIKVLLWFMGEGSWGIVSQLPSLWRYRCLLFSWAWKILVLRKWQEEIYGFSSTYYCRRSSDADGQTYSYLVPEAMQEQIAIGMRVRCAFW